MSEQTSRVDHQIWHSKSKHLWSDSDSSRAQADLRLWKLFDGLNDESLRDIVSTVKARKLHKNEELFHEGAIMQDIFLVFSGQLTLFSRSQRRRVTNKNFVQTENKGNSNSKTKNQHFENLPSLSLKQVEAENNNARRKTDVGILVSVLNRGQLWGTICALTGHPSRTTALATSESVVLVLPQEIYRRHIATEHDRVVASDAYFLQDTTPFDVHSINDESLMRIAETFRKQQVAANIVLSEQGRIPPSIGLIRRGECEISIAVDISHIEPGNKRVSVPITCLGAGDYFSLEHLDARNALFSVKSKSDSEIWTIRKNDLEQIEGHDFRKIIDDLILIRSKHSSFHKKRVKQVLKSRWNIETSQNAATMRNGCRDELEMHKNSVSTHKDESDSFESLHSDSGVLLCSILDKKRYSHVIFKDPNPKPLVKKNLHADERSHIDFLVANNNCEEAPPSNTRDMIGWMDRVHFDAPVKVSSQENQHSNSRETFVHSRLLRASENFCYFALGASRDQMIQSLRVRARHDTSLMRSETMDLNEYISLLKDCGLLVPRGDKGRADRTQQITESVAVRIFYSAFNSMHSSSGHMERKDSREMTIREFRIALRSICRALQLSLPVFLVEHAVHKNASKHKDQSVKDHSVQNLIYTDSDESSSPDTPIEHEKAFKDQKTQTMQAPWVSPFASRQAVQQTQNRALRNKMALACACDSPVIPLGPRWREQASPPTRIRRPWFSVIQVQVDQTPLSNDSLKLLTFSCKDNQHLPPLKRFGGTVQGRSDVVIPAQSRNEGDLIELKKSSRFCEEKT